eukprot:gene4191-4439_t
MTATVPQQGEVLYRAIEATSKSNINLQLLLMTCAGKHNMRTDWAMKPGSSCPPIPLNATATSLMLEAGERPVVSHIRPVWSWSNLLQAQDMVPQRQLIHAVAAGPMLGLECVKYMTLILLSVPALFLVMHWGVLRLLSKRYRGFAEGQQLVTCQHAVYAFVFTLQLIPQTMVSMRFLFKIWTANFVQGTGLFSLLTLIVMMLVRAALYLIEAAVRGVVKFSWLLIVHHTLFFAIFLMGVWSEDAPTLAISLTLDLFACHEMLLYVVLVGYRLGFPVKLSKLLVWLACSWYVLTRVMQTVVLLYMIIKWAAVPDVRRSAPFIVVSVLFCIFTVIQAYTLVIYTAIGRKLGRQATMIGVEPDSRNASSSCTVDAQVGTATGGAGVADDCKQARDVSPGAPTLDTMAKIRKTAGAAFAPFKRQDCGPRGVSTGGDVAC